MKTCETLNPAGHAFLTAGATVVCFILAEWLGLAYANLAVWTTYLVMVQYSYTRFQKGVERILGRAVGIFAGLVLTTWFHDTAVLTLALIVVLLTTFFYLYFAGRLAYTFLQAGLYVVAMFEIGHAKPESAVTAAGGLFLAIVCGVAIANVVTWLFGAEHDLSIQFGEKPLFPLRGDWLSQSLMLAVTVLITLFGAYVLDLPPDKAAISVMMLTVTPHVQAMIQKGELRLAGAMLATAWAVLTFAVIGVLPHFLLLAVMLFFGQFIAAYITRTAGDYNYAGMQMGLVLPMLIVAPRSEFGSFTPAVQRLEGIVMGLLVAVIVAVLWPRFPLEEKAPAALAPAPAFPGEMDV